MVCPLPGVLRPSVFACCCYNRAISACYFTTSSSSSSSSCGVWKAYSASDREQAIGHRLLLQLLHDSSPAID